ncbi:MAG: methyltransferase domain-containing protein [Candidatus Saganbacteria bacterium]|nr:methyltransferase domain-containing protein [Candidatus Saganbacteria bacterium]
MNLDIFRNVSYKTKTKCALCEKTLADPIIELPSLPLTDVFVKEKVEGGLGLIDQSFHVCDECGHAQLSNVVDPEVLYGSDYSFRTSKSMSPKSNDLFLDFIHRVTGNDRYKNIIELGCNDLYLLDRLADKADHLLGIDPILKGKEQELSSDKIKIIGDFFENVDSNLYKKAGNTLVLSSHVLEHIVDPKAFLGKILASVDSNTLFVFQFPGFDRLIENYRFDLIFHHHLHYFSLRSFTYLLRELNCELINFEMNDYYWGSMMVAFKKSDQKKEKSMPQKITLEEIINKYRVFKKMMESTTKLLKSLNGEIIYGYGAGSLLPILGYHLKSDFSSFRCIADENNEKDGLYYLNLPVSIKHPSKIKDFKNSTVVVTGLNFARSILRSLDQLAPKQIVLPINLI